MTALTQQPSYICECVRQTFRNMGTEDSGSQILRQREPRNQRGSNHGLVSGYPMCTNGTRNKIQERSPSTVVLEVTEVMLTNGPTSPEGKGLWEDRQYIIVQPS